MKDFKNLLDLMFIPNDTICVSNNKFANHSIPLSCIGEEKVTLVSPNKSVMDKVVKTEELIFLAINPINGFRCDENVYRYQTFLFEIDVGDISSQIAYVNTLKLTTTATIFSGNKSVHFLTILEDPIDEKTYRLLYQWALNIGTLFDKNCKNPSRSVRIPGAIRPDTGKEQKLIELKSKVKLEDFMAWLNQYEHLRPKEREKTKRLTDEGDYENLSEWAKNQFTDGIDFSQGRNRAYFALACDLFNSGYQEEEATLILLQHFVEQHDFKEREFLTTINSAFKYMANKG